MLPSWTAPGLNKFTENHLVFGHVSGKALAAGIWFENCSEEPAASALPLSKLAFSR